MQAPKPTSTKTCLKCGHSYSTKQKALIHAQIAAQTTHTLIAFHDTCLECIMARLQQDRDNCLPALNQAIRRLNIFERVYKKALSVKRALSTQHISLDQQYHYIKFFLREEQATAKAKITRQANKTQKKAKVSKDAQADLIATLLSNLTPEQRALVAKKALEIK